MNAITVKDLAIELVDLYKDFRVRRDGAMKGLKIVTIGGGSSYTPELVEGLIKRYDELPRVNCGWWTFRGGREVEYRRCPGPADGGEGRGPDPIHLTLDGRRWKMPTSSSQNCVGLIDARWMKIP